MQHTWINTEDSKKTRFGAFGLFVPKSPDAPAGPHSALLVRDWERFETLDIDDASGKVTRSRLAGEVRGLFVRDDVGFAVRDFVQNYPKEVELAPEGTWLHFWPRHNDATERTPSRGNLWRLWFAHQGKQLDFDVPKSYDTPELRPLVMFQGDGFSANAMGIGKTHEMLMVFGEAAGG